MLNECSLQGQPQLETASLGNLSFASRPLLRKHGTGHKSEARDFQELRGTRPFPKASETAGWGSRSSHPSSCLLSAQAYLSPSRWQAQSGMVPVLVTL